MELRNMLGIVDCKQIDDVTRIGACSVQATASSTEDVGWATKTSKAAARLERKLLLTLLASTPAAENAGGRELNFAPGPGAAASAAAIDSTSSVPELGSAGAWRF